jgi:Xaa-Pro aminopeptidase
VIASMRAEVRRRTALRWLAGASLGSTMFGCRRRVEAVSARPTADRATPPAIPDEDDRFAALRGACAGIAGPDAAEWAAHRESARARMRELDIAAVFVEPGASLEWLGGPRWHRSERPLLMLLPREGEPSLLCPAFERRTAVERVVGLELVTWREHEDPFAVLRARAPALGRARIAVDPSTRHLMVEGVQRAWPQASIVPGDPVLGPCRIRKQPAELARLRRANEATQLAIAAAAQHVDVGTTQEQVTALIEQALLAAGLVDPWVLALVGPNASFPHGTGSSRTVAPGDVVLVDTGAALHGYRSDITRTWVVGEPAEPIVRAWTAVAAAQRAALATIRPGVRAREVDAAARAVIAQAGYGPDDRYFTHRLGHGIGLEVHEPPYLVGGNELVLEPGMTMSVEPGIYVPGAFGIRLEDIVAVTDDGVEVFGALSGPLGDPFRAPPMSAARAQPRAPR